MNNSTVCPFPKGLDIENIDKIAMVRENSIPILHSKPNVTSKLYLATEGYFMSNWGSYTNISTPPLNLDNDSITEVWARVSEDFAPFNIDVTTEKYELQDSVVAVIAIGGSYSDWYGQPAGGVAYIAGFFTSAPGVGYVFANNLGNVPKYIAEAASHEAGHLFGLQHQSLWNGTSLVTPYNPGSGDWAPIMGVGYYMPITTWYNGPTPTNPNNFQDDMAIISNIRNGFGYVNDDYDGPTPVQFLDGNISLSGSITKNTDSDQWTFFTEGGKIDISINSVGIGSNLKPIIELTDSSNNMLQTGNVISVVLSAGQYFLTAKNNGTYGSEGKYSIVGKITALNGTILPNGKSLLLTVDAFDKKGNKSVIKNSPIWTGGNNIVDLIPDSNNKSLCIIKSKPGINGTVNIVCIVNGKSDFIEITVA